MIHRYEHKKAIWLDVVSPTAEEIRELVTECNIPPEFAGDLAVETPKTEVFSKKGFLKITLDFPVTKQSNSTQQNEIKFLVTKTHFVTIRFTEIEAVHQFSKEYELVCMLDNKGKKIIKTDILFLAMLKYLYTSLHAKLDYLESRLKDTEDEIFDGHEKEMVFELSHFSRTLITFRQTIAAHDNALEALDSALNTAFGKANQNQVTELEHHYRSLNRHLYALMSVLNDLKDTNNALLTTKQNELMKTFTILAFITFPLTLFSSLFGMNTEATPLVGRPGDFWFIVGAMTIVSIAFFAYFKHKKWI